MKWRWCQVKRIVIAATQNAATLEENQIAEQMSIPKAGNGQGGQQALHPAKSWSSVGRGTPWAVSVEDGVILQQKSKSDKVSGLWDQPRGIAFALCKIC